MESHGKPFPRRRRLFEFLEERQEPFQLELYLLENGHSSSNLLKSQQPSINCWPTETCRKLLRRRGGKELTCVLPKNWNFKLLRKALNWENRVPVGKTMPDSKQLSPVSVFELHSDEGCSANNHSMEEENTSTDEEQRYENCKLGSNHLLQQCGKEFEERIFGSRESLGNHRAAKTMELQVVSFGAASIPEWTETEWNRFSPEVMEIGLAIERFIFDEIREEVVVEMLGYHCFVL